MPKTFIQSRQYTEFYSQKAVTLIEHVMKTAAGKDAPQKICLGVSQPMHIHSPYALPLLASLALFSRSQSVFTLFCYFPAQHQEKFLYDFIHTAINWHIVTWGI